MYALQRGYWQRTTPWLNAGIGCLANSYSFNTLPLSMLPRLKPIAAAFYTIGCEFEGDQKALSDSWFVMYPAIVGVVLIFGSVINLVAKLFQRRMNDWMITTSIVLLSVIHYLRIQIAESRWFGFDGRLPTVILPDEFNQASVIYLLSSEGALRMSENVSSLLGLKLVVLGLNVLPLLLSTSMSLQSKHSRMYNLCAVEKAMTIRACNAGGIGCSTMYQRFPGDDSAKRAAFLTAYELVRLGYVVVGGQYLMTWENWLILTSTAPLRRIHALWNHRILVFTVHQSKRCNGVFCVSANPQLLQVNDLRLLCIRFWDFDARPLE